MNSHTKNILPKKATNLSIRVDLCEMAREDHLNLSRMLEESLILHKNQKLQKEWLAKNAKAIESMNQFIDETGVFSDGRRIF